MQREKVLTSIILLFILSVDQVLTYDFTLHGADWNSFNPICVEKGINQSPVDLGSNFTKADENAYIFPNYQSANILSVLSFDGFALQLKPKSALNVYGQMYSVNTWGIGVEFKSEDVKFKSEAEHTINGVRHPLEVQISHKNIFSAGPQGPNKSSVSLFFSDTVGQGTGSLFLQTIIDAWNSKVNTTASLSINLSTLIPKSFSIESFYFYQGSLNIPPCSEKSQWIVFDKVQEASAEQIQFFYNFTHNNTDFKGVDGNWREIQTFQKTAQNVLVRYKAAKSLPNLQF